ncbi:MAG: HD domain-containing phosphohydrolase [Nitrospiria bacterium]
MNTVMEEPASKNTKQHTLLFVDDEANILNSLRRLFYRDRHRILVTTNPFEAIEIVKKEPVDLVISDHRMPEMEGTKLLSKIKALKPDVVRIMLTGYADMGAAVEAINDARVYRFIGKPWNDDDLRLTVREALKQYDLVYLNQELTALVKEQNQELYDINRGLEEKVQERTAALEEKNKDLDGMNQKLEESFLDTVKALIGMMELKNRSVAGHGRRVSVQVKEVAKRLDLPPKDQRISEMAALLMDIGMIGYPDALLKKRVREMDQAERLLWNKHPLLAEENVKEIDSLRETASIIRGHHERYDGEGFPDGLWGERIPILARVLAASDYFDHLLNPRGGSRGHTVADALVLLEREAGKRLDPKVVHALIDVVKNFPPLSEEMEMEVDLMDLKEGMSLAKDLKTGGGILLLPSGYRLQKSHLERIVNFNKIDPIVDRIYVFRKVAN